LIELHQTFGYQPRVAVWELTLACNLGCRHCGSRAGRARPDELVPSEARRLCHDLAELGCQQLTLSGGEPTLRRDWPEIAGLLVDSGIRTGMITNGLGFTAESARMAKAVGLETVAFSVDGLAAAHDYQRRSTGSWCEVMRGIDRAVAGELRVSVVTTINQRNLDELERLRSVLGERGVLRWQLQFATPTGNLADHRELVMDPREVVRAVPLMARMCRDDALPKVYAGHDVGYFGDPEESLRDPQAPIPFWTGCPAGLSAVGIESNGNIKGCLSLPSTRNGVEAFVEGNIRDTPLSEIWSRPGGFAYCREFTVESLGGFCRTCDYNDVCRGGCTWTCYAERGLVRDNPYCYWRQCHVTGGQPPEPPRCEPFPG
jgi:radical SAM protein with 4Fe4S-binding SPASM domain